jgi:large subunit ribosomal protein L21
MFAIVDIAGFQEKVSKGDVLSVPTLDAEPGKTIVFDSVFLIVKEDGGVTMGSPTVAGATIEAKIVKHGKEDTIRVFKMKRRKRYRRTYGHRQGFTEIEITKISENKSAPKKEKEEVASSK